MITTAKHYDVVVLGGGLGALAAAALLARRSWRVLVLGHGHRRATYAYEGMTLARRAFCFLGASSPAFSRVVVELAQSQTFRRRLAPLDPMFQVLAAGLRLDVPPDATVFGREVERAFSPLRRVVDDLYAELARTNAAVDAAFDRDAVWPPGGFWERRETKRLLDALPWLDGARELLAEIPKDHAFRGVATVPARFASDAAGELPELALARLHGAWTRGVSQLEGGEDELVDFLLERVRAHGGETRMGDRASAILHRGGKVSGIEVDGDELPLGVTYVVGGRGTASLLELVRDLPAARADRAVIAQPVEGRFVVSMVVRSEGLPRPLGRESFVLPERGAPLHLQRRAADASGHELLVVERIVPRDASLAKLREETVGTVLSHFPFLERHLLVVDSPHDGLPLWDLRQPSADGTSVGPRAFGLRARLVERALLRAGGGSATAEPMPSLYRLEDDELHGLAGEPLRTTVDHAYVAGASSLPALGQEGELLAAWGVARIITKKDRRKEKMLREMWSKVELS